MCPWATASFQKVRSICLKLLWYKYPYSTGLSHLYLTMYIHKILHHYVLYTSSPSERNQPLLSRDREIFLRISRTRQIAFPRSMIECRSFLPTLISHKDGGRQKGKNSEYWHERWARSLSTSESNFSFARFIAFSMQWLSIVESGSIW